MKKRFFVLALFLFLLPPSALAAEGQGVRVAIIDTGISTEAISPDRIDRGINYIRPQDSTDRKSVV